VFLHFINAAMWLVYPAFFFPLLTAEWIITLDRANLSFIYLFIYVGFTSFLSHWGHSSYRGLGFSGIISWISFFI